MGVAQRLGLLLIPDQVLRAGTTGRLRPVGVPGDLPEPIVGQVLGSWASFEVSGLLDSVLDLRVTSAAASGDGGGFRRGGGCGARLGGIAGGCGQARARSLRAGTCDGLREDTRSPRSVTVAVRG